jgi:hypothetical protein
MDQVRGNMVEMEIRIFSCVSQHQPYLGGVNVGELDGDRSYVAMSVSHTSSH